MDRGPLPVGEIGKLLHDSVCSAALSTTLKANFGGLKVRPKERQTACSLPTAPCCPTALFRTCHLRHHYSLQHFCAVTLPPAPSYSTAFFAL